MPNYNEPELLDALGQIFATRNDMKTIVEYQQRLFASIQELNGKHREVHDFVRGLHQSHYRMQNDHGNLAESKNTLEQMLRGLDASHRQTQNDVRRAVDAIQFMQQEVRKMQQLEDRLRNLERELERFKQDDQRDDRRDDDQDQRLRKLESRR